MTTAERKEGGLQLRFGGGDGDPVLHVAGAGLSGENQRLEAVTLEKQQGRWRVAGWGGQDTKGLFVVPMSRQTSGGDDDPAAAQAELFVLEQVSGSGRGVTFRWGAQASASDDLTELNRGQAGLFWLQIDGAWLSVSILPRHMHDAEMGSAGVGDAMARLYRMVSDLWSWAEHHELHSAKELSGAVPVRKGQNPILWRCRQRRLQELLFGAGGVANAWAVLMADPVVRLESRYPVVPVYRARRMVVSGARGPWALDGGWSPDRPDGLVRDRVVIRTGDTPPNRLAVGLARLVLQESDAIQEAADTEERTLTPHWQEGIDRARRAAEAVLSCPSFAEVPPNAEVPLDSPALQNNSRCRKLLQAWEKLLSGLDRDLDWLVEDVLSEPIANTWLIYERWCFVALCHELKLGEEQAAADLDRQGKWLSWTTENHAGNASLPGRITIMLSTESDGDFMEDSKAWRVRSSQPGTVRSWSWPSTPDGFIVVDGRPHVWDAKYRSLDLDRYKSGYVYQAHAFRDVLTFDSKKVCWSVVLYPGLPTPDWAGVNSRRAPHGAGGVALVAVRPMLAHTDGGMDQAAHEGNLPELHHELMEDWRESRTS